MAAENGEARGTFNIGTGSAISLNRLVDMLRAVMGQSYMMVHGPSRQGDVRHCTASTACLREVLKLSPNTDVEGNLREYYAWTIADSISAGLLKV